jgi:hypothetical protein
MWTAARVPATERIAMNDIADPEEAIFQGTHRYSVGRRDLAEYYASKRSKVPGRSGRLQKGQCDGS